MSILYELDDYILLKHFINKKTNLVPKTSGRRFEARASRRASAARAVQRDAGAAGLTAVR